MPTDPTTTPGIQTPRGSRNNYPMQVYVSPASAIGYHAHWAATGETPGQVIERVGLSLASGEGLPVAVPLGGVSVEVLEAEIERRKGCTD